jgi:uncharacterized protein (DUF488 family)
MNSEPRYAASATVVLTVGHSNISLSDFLDSLHARGVRRIVDVRSAPYSRYVPHFNHEPLEAALDEAGIAYGYAGEFLGGRPTDPTCYFSGELPDGKANYLELVNYAEVARRDWYMRGIDRLIERARQGTTAVLCSEEDPARCHRHRLIARTLRSRQVDVQHMRATGLLEPAERTEERIAQEEGAAQLGLFDALETR